MIGILDRVRAQKSGFTPRTYSEFFALQLARSLQDTDAVQMYAHLARDYPELLLSAAYRRLAQTTIPSLPFRSYRSELDRGGFQGPGRLPDVLGIRIERRVLGLVLLGRGHIERVETRELSSSRLPALKAAEAFLRQAMLWGQQSTICLETLTQTGDFRRKELTSTVLSVIREFGASVWEVRRPVLVAAFGFPALRSMQQVRKVVSEIYPTLAGTTVRSNTLLDAAGFALHVHAARQFMPPSGGVVTPGL